MREKIGAAQLLQRPRDAARTVRRVFSRVDCLSCGACCKDEKAVPVTGADPSRAEIRAFLKAKGLSACIQPARNGGFNMVSDGGCPALEKGNGRYSCSMYGLRPVACWTFPFMPAPLLVGISGGGVSERMVVKLTSACPPVLKLKEAGITHVRLSDFTCPSISGEETLAPNLLGNSFRSLIGFMRQGVVFQLDHLLTNQKEPIFPIF